MTLSRRTQVLARAWFMTKLTAAFLLVGLVIWFVAVYVGMPPVAVKGVVWLAIPGLPVLMIAGSALRMATILSARRDREDAGLENVAFYPWEWPAKGLMLAVFLAFVIAIKLDWPSWLIGLLLSVGMAIGVVLIASSFHRSLRKA